MLKISKYNYLKIIQSIHSFLGPFVFGVITTIGEFQNLISAFDKRVLKVREIIIVDKSGTHVRIPPIRLIFLILYNFTLRGKFV